jgi:hypothetical protein
MAKDKKSDSGKLKKGKDATEKKGKKKKDAPVAEAETKVEKAVSERKAIKKTVVSKPKAAGKTAAPATAITISNDDIALRAYYIAERRQAMGWPGDSHSDWVEAERQLRAEAARKARG